MPTRDPANHPMAFSLLANREVPTSSEDWRHECEIAHLLEMPPEKRRTVVYGITGGTGDERGIKGVRGEMAANYLWSEVERLKALRQRG